MKNALSFRAGQLKNSALTHNKLVHTLHQWVRTFQLLNFYVWIFIFLADFCFLNYLVSSWGFLFFLFVFARDFLFW